MGMEWLEALGFTARTTGVARRGFLVDVWLGGRATTIPTSPNGRHLTGRVRLGSEYGPLHRTADVKRLFGDWRRVGP